MNLSEWQTKGDLNWSVKASPVYFYAEPTRLMESKTRKVIYRDDSLEPLSVVGLKYKPVQPNELYEFYQSLVADFGFQLEACGHFRGGAKVWALANTGESAFIKGIDGVQGKLLLATSYDTSLATTAIFTSYRVFCENSLAFAIANGTNAVRIGHYNDFNPTEVKDQLGLGKDAFKRFIQTAETLARIQMDANAATAFYRKVMHVTPDAVTADARVAAMLTQRFVARGYIAPEDTVWGAVNNLTEYYDHARRENAPGNRLHSAWLGAGAVVKQAAWNAAVELI